MGHLLHIIVLVEWLDNSKNEWNEYVQSREFGSWSNESSGEG